VLTDMAFTLDLSDSIPYVNQVCSGDHDEQKRSFSHILFLYTNNNFNLH